MNIKFCRKVFAIVLIVALSMTALFTVSSRVVAKESSIVAQNVSPSAIDIPPGIDPIEWAAENPALFLQTASSVLGWEEPAEPTKIAGSIYFVGTKGLGMWLITTSEGHILLNTGMPSSGSMIAESIRKLGFRPEDIKILLACHAHIDHVGGHAYIKRISGAQVAMINSAVDLIQSAGADDFHYGNVPEFRYDPVTVDQVFRDGDTIRLGDVVLTAYNTPGHSMGSTTFTMNVVEDGKVYVVVFPDGNGFNPGYRVVVDQSYAGIDDDYRRTFHTLEMLKPDIWLAPHNEAFDFEGKRNRVQQEGFTAWVDPEGYRQFVVSARNAFEALINQELEVQPEIME